MDETPAEPDRRPPRFPFVAALLCAACLGAAGWTWMRYSYAWDVTPKDVGLVIARAWPEDAYLRVRGRLVRLYNPILSEPPDTCVEDLSDASKLVVIRGEDLQEPTAEVDQYEVRRVVLAREAAVCGRLVVSSSFDERGIFNDIDEAPTRHQEDYIRKELVSTASRFHPASIAGLVVGAMGVFVFTVALRHWLRERRASARPTGC